MRKAIPVTLAVLAALGAAQAGQAQGIYKWVDERGRVTYSSTPPPAGREAREVQLPPGPTPEQVEAARARAESVRQQTERMAEERRSRGAAADAPGADAAGGDTGRATSGRGTSRTSDRPTVRVDDRVFPGPPVRPTPLPGVAPAAPSPLDRD
jgi:hypothetical protein